MKDWADDLMDKAMKVDMDKLSPEQKKEFAKALSEVFRSRDRIERSRPKKKSKLDENIIPLMITISIFGVIGILILIKGSS